MPGLTAREALLPAIARAAGLSEGKLLGIRESLGAIVIVIGPAAAGGLMVFFEGSAVLWITAATSLSAAAVTLLLPNSTGALTSAPVPGTTNSPLWNQLRLGWSTLRTDREQAVLLAHLAGEEGLGGLMKVYETMSSTGSGRTGAAVLRRLRRAHFDDPARGSTGTANSIPPSNSPWPE